MADDDNCFEWFSLARLYKCATPLKLHACISARTTTLFIFRKI